MGVDAEMFVRVKREVSDGEVRSLRLKLGDAFGADKFWIWRNGQGPAPVDATSDGGSSRHSVERVKRFTQDGDDIEPDRGETFLRVYPASRYYGIGYERGDLPFLLMLARFLREVTGGEVWYGGDSSGACAQVLDDAYERELWAHFVANGHRPYLDGMEWGGDGIPTAYCNLCSSPMRRYGAGSSGMYAPFCCYGCGADVETRDGGKTWVSRKEVSRA